MNVCKTTLKLICQWTDMFFETLLGYSFEYDKQLAFSWLFIHALNTVLASPKKDETAVCGWSFWLNPNSYSDWFTDKLIST